MIYSIGGPRENTPTLTSQINLSSSNREEHTDTNKNFAFIALSSNTSKTTGNMYEFAVHSGCTKHMVKGKTEKYMSQIERNKDGKCDDKKQYHKRLGHINRYSLRHLGLPYENDVCNICVESKVLENQFLKLKNCRNWQKGVELEYAMPYTPQEVPHRA
ncbi:hypothetical protein WA026_019839 [Henosepilachna vigintioctopunctata]|uniref:GAG-pre-integrase domain-containing protein n=1 Tax=Henosepilachna vigintioctopunctata TaxID=420089 RepID=A0AAW1VH03_9CUCU